MLPQLIRAPNHLGDGVLALPAILALAHQSPCWIDGPRWVSWLYRSAPTLPERPQHFGRAILFKPSFSAAWQARKVPEIIGLRGDWRSWLLTQGISPAIEHRLQQYSRIARAAGVKVEGLPTFCPTPDEIAACPEIPERSVLILPATASGPPVAWPGFPELAQALEERGQVPLFTGGPGEEEMVRAVAGNHRVIPTLSLGVFAALATRVDAVYGNDSGLSHLATAARRGSGLNPSDVNIYCGSTDPHRTAAPGAQGYRHPAPPSCWPCYKKRCRNNLECMPTLSNALRTHSGPNSMG